MTVIQSYPRLLLLALLALAVGAALALGWFTASHTMGFGGYKSTFVAKYDLDDSKLDSCDTCHNSDFSRNPFGQAIEDELALGNDTDTALANVESLDSDGDGATNVDEINALTWPGDAADSPAAEPTATDTPTTPAGTAPSEPTTTPTITATVTVTALPTTTPGEPPTTGGPPSGDGSSLTYVFLLLGALSALLAVVVIYVALPKRT